MVTPRVLQPGQRIRVLVVDDSVVARSLVARALEGDGDFEVAGFAANGRIAVARIPHVNPDVIILGVPMPEMDGMDALRVIRREYPYVRVVLLSSRTQRSASITLEALSLGADDYVAKPANEGGPEGSILRLRQDLIPRLKQFFAVPAARRTEGKSARGGAIAGSTPARSAQVVGIGVSTGGPMALQQVLPRLPADFPLPVLVVQHMPPIFTRQLAERLHESCKLAVGEASDGEPVEPGKILIAPGGFHMRTRAEEDGVRIVLDQSALQNSCRPAVDALFLSLAQSYGGAVIAAVLTGMGQDGLRGVEVLKARGGYVIAQDRVTSVVWGMPGAVVNAGFADVVVPLSGVAGAIKHQSAHAARTAKVPAWQP